MKPDALVLLGCRVRGLDELSGAARRRAERAARAYEEHRPALVIASGGRRWNGVTEAAALARALIAAGVPTEAIVEESQSLTTRENARYSAALLGARGFTRVGVVTCDWHLTRALACFRREGIEALGIPAPSPPVTPLAARVRAFREKLALLCSEGLAHSLTRAWRSS